MRPTEDNGFGFKQFQALLSWLLWGFIASARTGQVFARKPGTCGLGYFGVSLLLGTGVMLLVPPLLVPAEFSRITNEVYMLVVAAIFIMGAVHFWATLANRFRGKVIHSFDPGIPFAKPKPGHPNPPTMQTCRIVSDFIASGAIGILCFTASTPTLGWWYCVVVPACVLINQALISVRDDRRVQSVDDSIIEGQIMNGYVEDRYDHFA